MEDGWHYGAEVSLTTKARYRRSVAGAIRNRLPLVPRRPETITRPYPLVRKSDYAHRYQGGKSHQMDFMRGVADLADAIIEGREPRISARFALHVNEIVLALQYPDRMGSPRRLTSSFAPMAPMPWALQEPSHTPGGRNDESARRR